MSQSLEEFYKHPRTSEFDKIVADYVSQTGNSPFTNIEMKDESTGELALDMETNFTNEVEELFGEELNEVIGDYFVALISTMQKDVAAGKDPLAESEENEEDTQI